MKNQENKINRRSSLKVMGSGLALGLTAANYRSIAQENSNEKINFGFIGIGGMGTNRLKQFSRQEDVNAVAVCDVDESHLQRGVKTVQQIQEKTPKAFHDFRKLLELDEIDAVVVTTPDHWHAPIFVAACKAGKDVFVEKPLSHNIAEGRAMVEAAKENQCITQMGNHIHNDHNTYRRAVEMVRSEKLGKITRVHCWKSSETSGKGNPENQEPPEELNYNMWLGPAPKREYNPNRSHFNFRYFWDYSGGVFMDFWCHITDVAYWALDLKAPKTVSAVGGRFFVQDNTETPDCMELTYEYPDLFMLWTLHPKGVPGFSGGIGCIFHGTEATMVTNYNTNQIYVDNKKVDDFEWPEETIPNSPGHIREFLNAIKSRKKTTCNIEYAHKLNKAGLLGNIAYRSGDKLVWDDENERVIDNRKANRLVGRKYRKPWTLDI